MGSAVAAAACWVVGSLGGLSVPGRVTASGGGMSVWWAAVGGRCARPLRCYAGGRFHGLAKACDQPRVGFVAGWGVGLRPCPACRGCRDPGGVCGLLLVGLREFVVSVAWLWLCSVGWLSAVVGDVGDRWCCGVCCRGWWKGCAMGPLPDRTVGHSGPCRGRSRAAVGCAGWAWLPWLVFEVGSCGRAAVLGVWVVLVVAGCVVSGLGFGAADVAYVEVLGVGMVLVGRCGAGVAAVGMAAAACGSGGRLGGPLGSRLVVRGCIPPMR